MDLEKDLECYHLPFSTDSAHRKNTKYQGRLLAMTRSTFRSFVQISNLGLSSSCSYYHKHIQFHLVLVGQSAAH